MIKISDVVRDIVYNEEEALNSLSNGYMNLSAYAKRIKKEVSRRAKKEVQNSAIVISLSRLKRNISDTHPLVEDIVINNITTKSPLSEIVFEKSPRLLERLGTVYRDVRTSGDDFLTMTIATSEITIICSDRIKGRILACLKEKPRMVESGLASIGLTFNPSYYPLPNLTFSLIRRIARKRIALAETVTTHTEHIFIFWQKDLARMLEVFANSATSSKKSLKS